MRPSDHYQMLIREFTSVGIKPEVSKTNGGHLRFAFEAAGEKDSIVTSFTPSDHRSTLNARALVRRKLRAAGVYDVTPAQPLPLEKALEVPPGVDPTPARVSQLERDVGILLELIQEIGEEAAKVAYKQGWHAHALAVRKALGDVEDATAVEPPAPQPQQQPIIMATATPSAKPKKRTVCERVLANMAFDKWMSAAEIAKEADLHQQRVSNALTTLKKSKLVDHEDQKWRLRVQAIKNGNGHVNGRHARVG
jgi:hypothetical protein